ncbi:hypothetical protein ACE01N_10790 [Saccharicrinis sp. FJH2]|uniref:hypothetical protein n=1 Tax=Saccharicrinis sp. FJH65 TaxID=3344659 RepID=UPI0035F22A65
MKRLILYLLISAISATGSYLHAQSSLPESNNSIYVELGGNGMTYTFNMDHWFRMESGVAIAPRAGYGYTPSKLFNGEDSFFAFPFELSFLMPFKNYNNYLDVSPGITFIRAFGEYLTNDKMKALTIRAGYRYQKPEGGFLFRAGLLGIYNFYTGSSGRSNWQPWVGLSFGYAF